MDESQDSGGSGNFLSRGVGQGLASLNRSAAPLRPLPADALRTKEARALGSRTLGARLRERVSGFRRRSGREARAARAPRAARLPAGRKKPARLGRGCPRAPLLWPKATAFRPARNEWGRAPSPLSPPRLVWRPKKKTAAGGGVVAAPGAPAQGATSHFSFPTRPRPAPPGLRPAPGAQPPPAHPSSWRCAPRTLRCSGCR